MTLKVIIHKTDSSQGLPIYHKSGIGQLHNTYEIKQSQKAKYHSKQYEFSYPYHSCQHVDFGNQTLDESQVLTVMCFLFSNTVAGANY